MKSTVLLVVTLASSILLGAKPVLKSLKFEMPLPPDTKIVDVGGDSAIKTIEEGLKKILELRVTDEKSPLALRIQPGEYFPKKTLAISKDHSTTNTGPFFIFAADLSKKPRIHGGEPIKGWTKTTFNGRNNVWVADASKLSPPLNRKHMRLTYNGSRQPAARWPNVNPNKPYTTGFSYATKRDGAIYFNNEIIIAPEDRRTWAHPEDGVVTFCNRGGANYGWSITHLNGITNGIAYIEMKKRKESKKGPCWGNWCVQNIAEELDVPGEWYLDPRENKIYFMTPDGSDPNKGLVVLDRYEDVFYIGNRAGNFTLAGLEIVSGKSGIVINASDINILGCSIHDLGGFGIYGGTGIYLAGCRVRVADCDLYRLGSEGILIHSLGQDRFFDFRCDNVIENNYIHHCGEICFDGAAIFNCAQGARISNNLIHDMPRTAICGYGRFCDISYNRIRHTNLMSSDGGAMYDSLWTQGAGSKIRFNCITDAFGLRRNGDGSYTHGVDAAGIYFDECTGGTEVSGNFVMNSHWTGVMMHNARWLTVSNNVFISNGWTPVWYYSHQLEISSWSRGHFVRSEMYQGNYHGLVKHDKRWKTLPSLSQDPNTEEVYSKTGAMTIGMQFVNNVFSFPDQGHGVVLYGAGVDPSTNKFDYNLYWPGKGQKPRFATRVYKSEDTSWDAWHNDKKEDKNSVVANPQFRNEIIGDYRLKSQSPAFKLKFKDLPYDQMGLKVTKFRPTLPKEAEGVREHLDWLADGKEKAKDGKKKSAKDKKPSRFFSSNVRTGGAKLK